MTSRRPRVLWLPLASALLFTHCSCDIFDLFGSGGSGSLSEEDEAMLGAAFDRRLRDSAQAEYPVFSVRGSAARLQFQNYVTGIAQEIVDSLPVRQKPGYDFHFTVIDADARTAFAVPGGYVYICTGLIKTMRDEAELAGMLAHEISHVHRRHLLDAMTRQTGFSALVEALRDGDEGALDQQVAERFFSLAALAVTSGDESEADAQGTRELGLIRRNPLGLAKYFGRVPNPGPQWLASHPASERRVREIESRVAADANLAALAADSALTNYAVRFEAMTAVIR